MVTVSKRRKKNREEILKHKRDSERARKEKIKSNPVLYKKLKETKKKYYERQKAEGKIKPLNELPRHVQTKLRQRNRESSRKHYLKKKQKKRIASNESSDEFII